VNNGSTDGTKEWLDSQADLKVVHQENLGGAGGFHTGMKYAVENGADYVWIMDDDVVANPDALHELLHAETDLGDFSFLASAVYGIDGDILNVPVVDGRTTQNGYPEWPRFLSKGIVKIRLATFVSLLIPRKTIEEFGLPLPEFIMWGDDTEYTRRITKHLPAYMVGKSVVIHKRSIQTPPCILTETDRDRIKMYFYRYRNTVFLEKLERGGYAYRYTARKMIRHIRRCLLSPPFRLLKSKTVLLGYLAGFSFRPAEGRGDA